MCIARTQGTDKNHFNSNLDFRYLCQITMWLRPVNFIAGHSAMALWNRCLAFELRLRNLCIPPPPSFNQPTHLHLSNNKIKPVYQRCGMSLRHETFCCIGLCIFRIKDRTSLWQKNILQKKKNNKMKIKHTQKECVFVKILRQISYYQIPQMNNESNFMVLLWNCLFGRRNYCI